MLLQYNRRYTGRPPLGFKTSSKGSFTPTRGLCLFLAAVSAPSVHPQNLIRVRVLFCLLLYHSNQSTHSSRSFSLIWQLSPVLTCSLELCVHQLPLKSSAVLLLFSPRLVYIYTGDCFRTRSTTSIHRTNRSPAPPRFLLCCSTSDPPSPPSLLAR
ncbi:hypothetical protein DFH08DRAFT_53364 [Mycena albidolilacea]|uniref:Uncharacterized protein n=1 Tax=Mycena albidolilacea TaxID=1033008 RepID=A0AAD7E943_9AGAR|nr:hypothetical protein DFH08DRAFT_53364 [Mycena albidolilacea]